MSAGYTEKVAEAIEAAYKASVRTPPVEQASRLRQVLGSRLAAACLGLKDTRTLNSWIEGGPIRSELSLHRLQVLHRVVTPIDGLEGAAVAAAFMRGTNPHLGNRAPMTIVAGDNLADQEPALVLAVEALLTS